ncbi:deoxyribonuclease-1-like 1 [Rousettus aegyptiacus]|uniref:Deoxyribonuclease n=1 Tax=Rousettus aegyptiacus TaxID=9407 RepID=A0A7J8EIQ4_ROUAE|nr:deoxyribonuclease-1-like 1 [Rousettus aegyptiacus]KAF6435310.1 deoxyribonuclease 1 like 1 [Rousettus aegyptiacus]
MHCPAALLLLLLTGGAETFRICAFNVQRLSLTKVAKEHVMDTLVRILARCDIMVLQEVIDSSGNAISLLLRELNRFDGSGPYSFLSSPLLGRNTYMEKYVYIYRSHRTKVLDSYVYNDKEDLFAREPFVAQFTLPSNVLPSLVLVPLHTTPKAVAKELDALYDVFLDVSQHWKSKDIILLGDFNADCSSLPKKQLSELELRTHAGFYWAIPDEEDTTVRASTHCAYDRIVLYGERCQSLLRTAATFEFPKYLQLTEEEALNISDHYPVEVELKLSQAAQQIRPLSLTTLLLPSLLLPLLPLQLGPVA